MDSESNLIPRPLPSIRLLQYAIKLGGGLGMSPTSVFLLKAGKEGSR